MKGCKSRIIKKATAYFVTLDCRSFYPIIQQNETPSFQETASFDLFSRLKSSVLFAEHKFINTHLFVFATRTLVVYIYMASHLCLNIYMDTQIYNTFIIKMCDRKLPLIYKLVQRSNKFLCD